MGFISKVKNKVKNSVVTFSKKIDKMSSNPILHESLILGNEKKLYKSYAKKSKNYLEFGSGGSTFDAIKLVKNKVISVESSYEWYKHLLEWRFIRKSKKLDYVYIDIGKTGWLGTPLEDKKEDFKKYYSYATPELMKDIDTVLIDGRFRVATALHVASIANKDTIVMFHDFYREHYHVVLKYFDIINTTGELFILKIKDNIDMEDLKRTFELYKNDSR